MKCVVLLSVIILVSYIIGLINNTNSFIWMDRNFTTAVKGSSILMIVWAHCGARLGVGGIQFIAGIGVSLFLICSGYGLELSYQKSGLDRFWRKRFLGICLPFWIVELVGLFLTNSFTVQKYAVDFFFLKPATGYGWFMGYIMLCYLIFFGVKHILPNGMLSNLLLLGVFAIWFVLDSIFFVNPNMPFLRARQMLSFPCGVLIAQHMNEIVRYLTKVKSILFFIVGAISCILFMAITQLQEVKQMPYLLSNLMSLFTCFPMAVGLLAFGKSFGRIFHNRILVVLGSISFEIYLVHAFSLCMVNGRYASLFMFILFTIISALFMNVAIKRVKAL